MKQQLTFFQNQDEECWQLTESLLQENKQGPQSPWISWGKIHVKMTNISLL